MLTEARLKEKYDSYLIMCEDEEIDPVKVLTFEAYSRMYQEIVQMDTSKAVNRAE